MDQDYTIDTTVNSTNDRESVIRETANLLGRLQRDENLGTEVRELAGEIRTGLMECSDNMSLNNAGRDTYKDGYAKLDQLDVMLPDGGEMHGIATKLAQNTKELEDLGVLDRSERDSQRPSFLEDALKAMKTAIGAGAKGAEADVPSDYRGQVAASRQTTTPGRGL